MSSGAAQTWFIAGTIPLMLAGGLHAVTTVLDVARPTFFTPIEDSVRAIAVPAAYLAISLFFWLYGPALVAAVATACFIMAAVLA